MPDTKFAAEILESVAVVNHIADGHIYRFPIQSNGNVSLNGRKSSPIPRRKIRHVGISSTPTPRLGLHFKRANIRKMQGKV